MRKYKGEDKEDNHEVEDKEEEKASQSINSRALLIIFVCVYASASRDA